MNLTQFTLINEPDSHCLAVYQDKNTGLIERSLIVSPLLFDKLAPPVLIVKLEPEGFNKYLYLHKIDSIIVTSTQWLSGDKLDNSQRTSL